MWFDWTCWGSGLLSLAVLGGLIKRTLDFGTFLRMELKDSGSDPPCYSDQSRPISVIIPARNEERFIERSTRHVLESEFSPMEVILVDDRSEDRTREVMEHLAGLDSRVAVIAIRELPTGWNGKAHALWQAGLSSSGDILVFTDADAVLGPRTLSLSVDYLLSNDLAMLSLAPGFIDRRFIEEVLHPFLSLGLLLFYPLKDVNDPKKAAALASGCFIMIRRQAYEAVGTWAAFKHEMTEDIAMARAVKAHGLTLATLRGNDLVHTRQFESLSEVFCFWKRAYYGGLNRDWRHTLILTLFYLSLSVILAFCAVTGTFLMVRGYSPATSFAFTTSFLVVLALVIPHGIFLARSGGKWVYSLASPLGVLFGALVAASTLASLILRNGITWRGTLYK